ncbi:MAG: AraC family transcriptional regulator ligand-binding domain-containing protein [Pseudomonadota bacterium]
MNSFLEQFPQLVTARGGNFSELCKRVGLPAEMATGKHQLIPFDNFIALLEVADETLDYPEIAFDLTRRQSINAIGPLTQLISSCETFGDALRKIVAYLKVLTSGFDIRLVSNEYYLALHFDVFVPTLLPKRQFQNYLLASSVSILRRVIGGQYPLRGCFFARNETDARLRAIHSEFFACPVIFAADEIKITIDRAILDQDVTLKLPITQLRKPAHTLGSRALEHELSNAITLSLPSGKASLANVAWSMGYSERTLRRRLSEAELSFSQILQSVRFDQANRYLQSTHYTLCDIAALLGYSNQSAFTRSYIKWSGVAPSSYRQELEKP